MPFNPPFVDPDYGDLFYGLARERGQLTQWLAANGHMIHHICTIDQYDLYGTKAAANNARSGKSPLAKRLRNNHNHDQKFVDFIDNHPKRQGVKDVDLVDGAIWNDANTRDFAINVARRKCKAGLEYIISETSGHIHFCLDGIDFRSVVEKNYAGPGTKDEIKYAAGTPEEDKWKMKTRSITGAELRWVYRNRMLPAVSERVQFWYMNQAVIPPWEVGAPWTHAINQLWASYIPKNSPKSLIAKFYLGVQAGVRRYDAKWKFNQSKESKAGFEFLKNCLDGPNKRPVEDVYCLTCHLLLTYFGNLDEGRGVIPDGFPLPLKDGSSLKTYLLEELANKGFTPPP
ncbi:MAG: hypothetical protein RIQ52_1611 [Pseudomonadota bacterium]|jgi:hypothetical protein